MQRFHLIVYFYQLIFHYPGYHNTRRNFCPRRHLDLERRQLVAQRAHVLGIQQRRRRHLQARAGAPDCQERFRVGFQRHRGAKPFEISAERAAGIIVRGLERRAAIIAFPLPLAILATLGMLIPPVIADWFENGFRAYVVPDDGR